MSLIYQWFILSYFFIVYLLFNNDFKSTISPFGSLVRHFYTGKIRPVKPIRSLTAKNVTLPSRSSTMMHRLISSTKSSSRPLSSRPEIWRSQNPFHINQSNFWFHRRWKLHPLIFKREGLSALCFSPPRVFQRNFSFGCFFLVLFRPFSSFFSGYCVGHLNKQDLHLHCPLLSRWCICFARVLRV